MCCSKCCHLKDHIHADCSDMIFGCECTCHKLMSKLDELDKEWNAYREVVDPIGFFRKYYELGKLEEREVMKKKMELLKAKYTYNEYKGCFEDFYSELLSTLNNQK